MSFAHTIGGTTYCFADVRTLLAKASPLSSSDAMAWPATNEPVRAGTG